MADELCKHVALLSEVPPLYRIYKRMKLSCMINYNSEVTFSLAFRAK
jgi:hypothetical protein